LLFSSSIKETRINEKLGDKEMLMLSSFKFATDIHAVIRRPSVLFLLISYLLILCSCVTPDPIRTSKGSTPDLKVSSDSAVLILKPMLKFERIHDESVIPASEYDGNAIEIEVINVTKNMISSRNIALADIQSDDISEDKIFDQLNTGIPKLARGVVKDEASVLLKSIATNEPNISILVSYFRVKVGSDGSWDPNSGAIRSSNSKVILNAALIQCATGKVLWLDQVLLREIPKLSSPEFYDALDLLFMHFPQKES